MHKPGNRLLAVIAVALVGASVALYFHRDRALAAPANGEGAGDSLPIQGTISAGESRLHFDGTLRHLRRLQGLDVDFSVQGPNPAELKPILSLPVPPAPPYDIRGHARHQGKTWSFSNVTGTIGDTDFAGTGSLDRGGERPLIRADVHSQEAYWDDVEAIFGDPFEPKPSGPAAQRNLLLVDTVDVNNLRKANAAVRFHGDKVLVKRVHLADVSADVEIRDGVLTFGPLEFDVAGGHVRSHGRVDASERVARTSVNAEFSQVALNILLARFDISDVQLGAVGGRARLSGAGNSVARFFDTASGALSLIMAGGRVKTLLVDLAELDLLEVLQALGAGEAGGRIHCAIGDFELRDGIATVKLLAIEIPDAVITGEGTINFPEERVDLTFTPHPKDPGLIGVGAVVNVTGPITSPSISLDSLEFSERAEEAIALESLADPLAGLLALIRPSGETPHCRRLLQGAPSQQQQE